MRLRKKSRKRRQKSGKIQRKYSRRKKKGKIRRKYSKRRSKKKGGNDCWKQDFSYSDERNLIVSTDEIDKCKDCRFVRTRCRDDFGSDPEPVTCEKNCKYHEFEVEEDEDEFDDDYCTKEYCCCKPE